MGKHISNNGEIESNTVSENVPNGISFVTTIKTQVTPIGNIKGCAKDIDEIEAFVKKLCRDFVHDSDFLSDNVIVDFDCTRENLKIGKWSKLKIEVYAFSEFSHLSEKVKEETVELGREISSYLTSVFN